MDFNPVVRKRWKRLSAKLLDFGKNLAVQLFQAFRLGVMDKKTYMNYLQEKDNAPVKNRGTKASAKTAAQEHQQNLQRDCQHLEVKRHGNRHGSYATCLRCKARWLWDGTGWKLHGCSSRLLLPLPSFLTTVDGSIQAPASQADYLPLKALASKAKPKPGSGTRQPKTRSRPPSMTSSAAGHLLREEELQDVDQDMDLLSLYSWSDVASD